MTDASDADRLEQNLPIDPLDDEEVRLAPDPEAPEADALEQAFPAPLDEEDQR
jgi:hypothetical protein